MSRDVIIYIVMAIIFFVLKNLKKKPAEQLPQNDGNGDNESQQSSKPPTSFEDLLRELTTGATPAQQTPPPQRPVPKPSFEFPSDGRNYEEVHDEWEDKKMATLKEGGHTRLFSDEETKKVYQDSIHISRAKEDELTAQLKKAESRFKEFEIQEDDQSALRNEIVDMLSSQDGAKKAIILSEILNRKY